MDKHNDSLQPVEACGAAVATALSTFDQAHAEGMFKAVCMGPSDFDRARYIAIRDELAALEAKSLLARIMYAAKIQGLRDELEAIPLEEKWVDEFPNTVVTVGKNLAFSTIFTGSAYTVTGPFMGLISATPTTVIGDTMASHAGWNEVGNANAPTYTAPRKTVAWNAASGGAISNSTALTFAMTATGTVGGAFIVYGTGAVSTIDSTTGTLWSAGAFTGGNRSVNNGDTLTVSYSVSM